MTPVTTQAENQEQARELARRAGEILRAGGLVVFPTETVYGVGASALNETGYEALRQAKGRPVNQPFTLHIPDPGAAERYVDISSPVLRRLLRKVFPGPVTLVVDVSDQTIADRLGRLGLPPEAQDRIYHNNTVGLRCPDHELGQMVLASVDGPIVASSANRRGEPPPRDAQEAAAAMGADVGLVIDGGPCRFAKPSTIVRVQGEGTGVRFRVERAGVYDERYITKMLRWTMLLVCTGNTCRSPMAEALARKILADERKLAVEDLETAGLRVISAGTHAAVGAPAAPDAVDTMNRMGIDISRHRAHELSPELLHEADVIFCMTRGHREDILSRAPWAQDKTLLLDPNGDIEDPIGSGKTAYQRCAEVLRRRLEQRLKEHQPWKIALGADHRGNEVRAFLADTLAQQGCQVVLIGPTDGKSCDYPDVAYGVAGAVSAGHADRGILICGTGIGMSIAANKIDGVRAALVHDEVGADMSRRHNDANVLCLPADLLGLRIIDRIVKTWLATTFEGGRHARRVQKIGAIEQGLDPQRMGELDGAGARE